MKDDTGTRQFELKEGEKERQRLLDNVKTRKKENNTKRMGKSEQRKKMERWKEKEKLSIEKKVFFTQKNGRE